ncbi:MAG: ParB N-terminal domain-containing protein, partial [Planctomycetota bacterium]
VEILRRTGLYPPLIVRPHPRRREKFEILDGCGRAEALRECGFTDARCEVWPVDDDAADLLVVTLHRLRGRTPTRDRARQTRRLAERLGEEQTRRLLGLTPAGLRQQLTALDRPKTRRPARDALDLRPVVFHLPPAEAARLEQFLACHTHRNTTRGQALLQAVQSHPAPPPDAPA